MEMRIMDRTEQPLAKPRSRHDGWTAERRERFLECLAAGIDVRRACGRVGLSREAAYRLRRREEAFAQAWDDALRAACAAAEKAWLATLPERLRRTMSGLSGECELHLAGVPPQHCVRGVRPV